jgi:hypothetical protein
MSTETLNIKFTGKNYVAWEFQFRMFLKGKELWSILTRLLLLLQMMQNLVNGRQRMLELFLGF